MTQLIESLKIVAMCILAAVIYGVVHDQITARICVEYFTVGHPPVFKTEDPTLLGLGWGVIATWWVGLILGVALAAVARFGNRPCKTAGQLVRPVIWLMAITAVIALLAGIVGWQLGRSGLVFLVGPITTRLPDDRHVPFLADLWAHSGSYVVGFVGGLVVLVHVWRVRGREATDLKKLVPPPDA